MAATGQQLAFRCDQCGNSEIVALSLLHEQGTRSFSGRFTSGVSQSFTARAASPPKPRGYLRAGLEWGFPIIVCCFWGLLGLSAIAQHSRAPFSLEITVAVLLFLGCILILSLLFSFRRIARYNREVYPHLYSDWAHTFMCRRCGKYSLIRP